LKKQCSENQITDRAFSTLGNIEFMVNPEFHSGLLRELPSAILVAGFSVALP
jgi:hypothetical protein